jgi:hypothetical protein
LAATDQGCCDDLDGGLMAGLYTDAPGAQVMYDRDGSAVVYWGGSPSPNPTELAGASVTVLNSQAGTALTIGGQFATPSFAVIFPETMDIVGLWPNFGDRMNPAGVATSVDTTNGYDGTWVTQSNTVLGATFRAPTVVSWSGVKAVRFQNYQNNGGSNTTIIYNVHFYGQPTSAALTATPTRLRVWHPTLNQVFPAAGFDYADASRTYTFDKTFRIKNTSATLTANSIVLSTGALTDTSPTVLSQLSLSQGSGFASTQTITSLAPGAISAVCTLRFIASSSATLSIWRQRLIATAGSWT